MEILPTSLPELFKPSGGKRKQRITTSLGVENLKSGGECSRTCPKPQICPLEGLDVLNPNLVKNPKIRHPGVTIDEKTLDNEINEIFKNQNFVDEFRISEIEVQLAGNEANKNKINEIQKLINEIGFGKAALKLSVSTSATEEGDLGWLTAKSLSDEIYDVISNMQINEITDPIIDQNRILFLKLNDKRKLKTENIDSNLLRKNLVNRKKNELYNLYSRSHLSKLRNTTSIEYK